MHTQNLHDDERASLLVTQPGVVGDPLAAARLTLIGLAKVVAKEGAGALDIAVRSAMTPKVKICNENHTVNEVMEIMTKGRFRHLPDPSYVKP